MKRNKRHREDLKDAWRRNPLLRMMSYIAIKDKLRRADPTSEIGRLWAAIPQQPNILRRLFPDPAMHVQLAQDLTDSRLHLRQLTQKYPNLEGLSKSQRRDLRENLGINPNGISSELNGGTQNWFLHLPPKRKREFEERFLDDYKDVPLDGGTKGITNRQLLELWPECPGIEGLRSAAKHLGEPRTRLVIIRERKTIAQVESAIEQRLSALINAGALHSPGIDTLFGQITHEFAADIAASKYHLTKELFLEKIEKLVWTEGRQGVRTALTDCVKWDTPLANFRQFHPYIPLPMIERKARELRGITNILRPPPSSESFVRGIQRYAGRSGLKGSRNFELPPTSFHNPYVIPMDSPSWDVMNINGMDLGVLHSPVIAQNSARRAFAQAEQAQHDAVVLTNVFDVETKKAAGPSRVLQALVSGITIDIEALDSDYREDAQRILATWLESNEDNGGKPAISESPELLYVTAAEIFRLLSSRGLRKITFKPSEKGPTYSGKLKPEYSGPVYVILGINEERIITAAAYWEVHRINLIRQHQLQHQLQAEIRAATSALKRLTNPEGDAQEIERIQKELDKLIDLEARTRITNVTREEWKQYYNKALEWFVKILEDPEVIPNCKVIGKNTTYVKLGDKIIKFFIPGHTRVSDGLLAEYANSYGPEVLRGEIPNMTVICHPYALGHKLTAREADAEGRRGAIKVCVAPICADTRFIRESSRQIVQKAHPIQRVAFNELSAPGVIALNCTDGVINTTDFPLEALEAFGRHAQGTSRTKRAYRPKYIWIKVATDQHWGAKTQEHVTCNACRVKLGMSDAVFHALRHAGYNSTNNFPPIHMYVANDDPTQGHHFPAEHEPHPHELSFPVIEAEMWKRLDAIRKTRGRHHRQKLEDGLVEFALYQFHTRGVYCTTQQMLLFIQNYLKGNSDMFDGILRRAHEAKLILRGVSHFARTHSPHMLTDSRDLGLISLGTGNHFLNTVEGSVSEGPIYAEVLREQLLQNPFWQDKADVVSRSVKGSTYGKEFIGWGTIQAPGGYEWGLDFRNTPPGRGVDWGDPLRIAVKNDQRRGNYARILEGKVAVKIYGDKHFLTYTRTPNAIYLMGPPGAHTDLYGELGFPPNNTGIVFIGLPAEGPTAGPILIRALLYDDIRRLVQDDPHDFPWEEFLPDAL